MRLLFSPEAQREILEAQAWYEARAEGLGIEFALAVETAAERALRTPAAFPFAEAEFQQVLMRKFPYSLIYHATESTVLVVACFHHRRQPGSWLRPGRT